MSASQPQQCYYTAEVKDLSSETFNRIDEDDSCGEVERFSYVCLFISQLADGVIGYSTFVKRQYLLKNKTRKFSINSI